MLHRLQIQATSGKPSRFWGNSYPLSMLLSCKSNFMGSLQFVALSESGQPLCPISPYTRKHMSQIQHTGLFLYMLTTIRETSTPRTLTSRVFQTNDTLELEDGFIFQEPGRMTHSPRNVATNGVSQLVHFQAAVLSFCSWCHFSLFQINFQGYYSVKTDVLQIESYYFEIFGISTSKQV